MKCGKFFVFILGTFMTFVSCEKNSLEWKGTIEKNDGVTVVKNPREPVYMYEEALVMEEDLTIGEAAGRTEYMFSEVRSLATDDEERIYVLDAEEHIIRIYDKYGEFIKKFGRIGQGPGELSVPNNMIITIRDEIMVKNSTNISFYSLGGEFIKSVSTAALDLTETKIDEDGKIVGLAVVRDVDNPRYELKKFDPDLNYLLSLGSSPLPILPVDGFNPFLPVLEWDLVNGSQIVCGFMKDYEIKIYDDKGKLIRKILKEYKPVEVTQEDVEERFEKEELLGRFEKRLRERMKVPEYHNPFQDITADDEGKIFVMTHERVPAPAGYFYDVFDAEGRFIAKIPLENRPLLIKNGKLFAVEEDAAGYKFVKRYRLHWLIDKPVLSKIYFALGWMLP